MHKQRWMMFAPLGLALIGFGVSVIGYAVELRTLDAAFRTWFWWGTAGLVILNSGVACFGEAVKCRVLYELEKTGNSKRNRLE